MTDVLARLRQLEAAATPGPWEWFDDGADSSGLFPGDNGLRNAKGAHVLSGDAVGAAGCGWIRGNNDDMTLIAAARNALPRLLAIAEAASHYNSGTVTYIHGAPTDPAKARLREAFEALAALDSQETE